MRSGIGFDVHAFDKNRKLKLGGVVIDGAPGLAGWSDADVVCHAVIDALLGACALGDLGTHFSESEVDEGTSSLELMDRACIMISEAGFRILNVDVVVVVQDIRISGHREEMVEAMAKQLKVDRTAVSVKATTSDHLGFTGRGEGIAALATASVDVIDPTSAQIG